MFIVVCCESGLRINDRIIRIDAAANTISQMVRKIENARVPFRLAAPRLS